MADDRPPTVAAFSDRGLTTAEVADRVARGAVNVTDRRTSRSVADIVRANILTRFNAIITVLAAVVLAVGHPIDALFAFVMVVNSAIGIFQEVRAKRTLDRLTVLIAPTVLVVRDGEELEIEASAVVIDDLIRLRAGDEVPVDGIVVVPGSLEVDESALTGESDPVAKQIGDDVRSGSFVIAGTASVVATAVGGDAWIEQLVSEARQFVLTRSELRSGVDAILRVVGWIIAPLAALSAWSQLRGDRPMGESLVSSVAAVVGLVPQGLVLLVSMAMAVAIIRLARQHVVVQELYAVEGLARVDVLCVDKTGTLTTGRFRLDEVVAFDGDLERLRAGLGALVANEVSPTSSSRVLAEEFPAPAHWTPIDHTPFSSARKWSATGFADRGSWVLGAPEVLFDAMGHGADDEARTEVGSIAASGHRVLLVASSAQPLPDAREGAAHLPGGLRPAGYVVLGEEMRSDAAEIMEYFGRQGVDVKIISGDNSETVSAVGRRLGIAGAEHHVDLRITPEAVGDVDVVEATTVFGRVSPEQKRDLVGTLQAAGRTVAMTGDGVNDIPSLKRADMGIAVDTATPATKSVAQVVLLDGRFDRLPSVVAEGRRVIANMERVSALFITKTIYSVVLILAIGVSGSVFPFLPRHMSLVSELTIGVPAFLLSFRAADRPSRPGYLRRVIRFALPAGMLAATVTLTTYWVARSPWVDASLNEARSVATMALSVTALWILLRLMQPLDRLDLALLAGLVTALAIVAVAEPTQRFYALEWPAAGGMVVVAVMGLLGIVTHELARVRLHPLQWRPVRWLLDRLGATELAQVTFGSSSDDD